MCKSIYFQGWDLTSEKRRTEGCCDGVKHSGPLGHVCLLLVFEIESVHLQRQARKNERTIESLEVSEWVFSQ